MEVQDAKGVPQEILGARLASLRRRFRLPSNGTASLVRLVSLFPTAALNRTAPRRPSCACACVYVWFVCQRIGVVWELPFHVHILQNPAPLPVSEPAVRRVLRSGRCEWSLCLPHPSRKPPGRFNRARACTSRPLGPQIMKRPCA